MEVVTLNEQAWMNRSNRSSPRRSVMTLYTIVRKSRRQPERVQAYKCVRHGNVFEFWSSRTVGAEYATTTLELQIRADDVVSIDPPVRAHSPERSP